jgi:hypothetical protein
MYDCWRTNEFGSIQDYFPSDYFSILPENLKVRIRVMEQSAFHLL